MKARLTQCYGGTTYAAPHLYMGVDIGTTSVKGVVINDLGKLICDTYFVRQNEMQNPIAYEHDADHVWWNEFSRTTNNLSRQLGNQKKAVRSIAVTAMVPNILPIYSQGRPLRNAILYYDGRAQSIEEQLDAELGTSKPHSQVLAQLIWLRKELAPNWKNAARIL